MKKVARASRKQTETVEISDLTSMNNYAVIARSGRIINASSTGFLMEIDRRDLIPQELRENLSLQSLLGQNVVLYLPQMNLDLDGTVIRASHIGKGVFAIAVTFSADVPEYWRESLVDLLPSPGELEEKSKAE